MTLPADAYNSRELAASKIVPTHITRLTAHWQTSHGLEVDGKLGPNTRESVEALTDVPAGTGGEPADQSDAIDGVFEGPLDRIPINRSDVYRVFGDPGTKAKPNKRWRKSNIVEVRDLPGVPRKWYFQVHRLAEPYMREAMRRAQVASDYVIARAGCFNLRHIQHNPAKPLSLHSFGIAVDIDAGRNSAKRFKRGDGPVPFAQQWKKLWPEGIDREFVEAFESVGFTWGGVWGRSGGDFLQRANAATYFDPMHFELRLRG